MSEGSNIKRICLGAFAGAHGVKGQTLIKCFTEKPENIAAYGPVETEDKNRRFTLAVIRTIKSDTVVAAAPEILSREDAGALKGVRLYAPRAALPETAANEFYADDLVGSAVLDEAGEKIGCVSAVYNFGAGDLLEIAQLKGAAEPKLAHFTRDAFPKIDAARRTLTISRPALREILQL